MRMKRSSEMDALIVLLWLLMLVDLYLSIRFIRRCRRLLDGLGRGRGR